MLFFVSGLISLTAIPVRAAEPAYSVGSSSVEFLHFWVSRGERNALDLIAETFHARGGEWLDTPASDYQSMKRDAVERLSIGLAPSAMLWLGGEDVLHLGEMGLVRQLNDIAEQRSWYEHILPIALAASTAESKLMGVPLYIHNENWSWYNAAVYRELELPLPQSWQMFLDQAPVFEAAGVMPLAIGQTEWEVRLLFNTILVGVAGPDLYRRLYSESDPAVLGEPRLLEALRLFGALRQYRPDLPTLQRWDDAVGAVITGRAAMSVNGDWAKAEFITAGMRPGLDFHCLPAPETRGLFIASVDLVVFPSDADPAVKRGQDLLIDILSDPELVSRFSQAKGSLPARTDIDITTFDECARKSLPSLKDSASTLLSPRLTMSEEKRTEVQDALVRFWRDDKATLASLQASLREALE